METVLQVCSWIVLTGVAMIWPGFALVCLDYIVQGLRRHSR